MTEPGSAAQICVCVCVCMEIVIGCECWADLKPHWAISSALSVSVGPFSLAVEEFGEWVGSKVFFFKATVNYKLKRTQSIEIWKELTMLSLEMFKPGNVSSDWVDLLQKHINGIIRPGRTEEESAKLKLDEEFRGCGPVWKFTLTLLQLQDHTFDCGLIYIQVWFSKHGRVMDFNVWTVGETNIFLLIWLRPLSHPHSYHRRQTHQRLLAVV